MRFHDAMSQITIQCRLVASESTRQYLWKLMDQLNTPLINELLKQVGQHSDFESWLQKGKLKSGIVRDLCKPLRDLERFQGQPGRFYDSAIAQVEDTYKSTLAVQQRLKHKLERQNRWLEILKSDTELVEASSCSLDALRTRAAEILARSQSDEGTKDSSHTRSRKKGKKTAEERTGGDITTCSAATFRTKKRKSTDESLALAHSLFQVYFETENVLSRCAIAYLIKNGYKVSDKEEDLEKFAKRRRKAEIRVERLNEQLKSRMPSCRDLRSEHWLATLSIATTTVPQNEDEARFWQDSLLKKPKSVPFPVAYETNEDMTWFQNEKGRICVCFNGLSEHTFEIYCDRRQLHWFKRFLEDQQTKQNSKDQHSSSLFTLRSGRIVWQEEEGKGDPWNIHHLSLHCCVDTRLWTEAGTEQVRQEKAADIAKTLTAMNKKGDLNKNQQAFVKRKQSTLQRINNPFPRPRKPLYQGQSHILVGVSFGLDKPATVAVVDGTIGKVLTYRSVRQLLGDNYQLLNRQRQQQQLLSHQRHKAQKRAASNHFGTSELGQYVDRKLAQAIVAIAVTYQAGSIVLPKLDDMREIVQSEIQVKAEQKCPGYVEGQAMYAKLYRVSVHNWSYGRLIESIQGQAAKIGVAVEQLKQPLRGNQKEKARDLAIAVYQSRSNV